MLDHRWYAHVLKRRASAHLDLWCSFGTADRRDLSKPTGPFLPLIPLFANPFLIVLPV